MKSFYTLSSVGTQRGLERKLILLGDKTVHPPAGDHQVITNINIKPLCSASRLAVIYVSDL